MRGRRPPAENEQRTVKKLPLVNTFVLRRRMELDSGRVARQIDRNAVVGVNGESASAEPADPRNMHLLRRQRNIVVAGMFDDGLANVFFRASAVGPLQGFGFDLILKLIVREERRDQLDAHQSQHPEDGYAED